MLICFPLIQNVIALLRTTYRVQHITVTLAMDALLKGLNMQAEIDFICCNVFTDSRQIVTLQGVKENKEAQYLVISCPFRLIQMWIILCILSKIDFFGYPEIIHGLTIPVTYPFVVHIVEIIQISCIPANHFSETEFGITLGIEEGILL